MKKLFIIFSLFSFHFSLLHAQDTLALNKKKKEKTWKPYILVSYGACLPTFDGYGGNQFRTDFEYGPQLSSGYARNGSIYNAAGGLTFSSGWEITGMISTIHNQFDATGVMNETNDYAIHHLDNINATGNNYSYTNYSWLLGVTKNSTGKYVRFGFSLLAGKMITYISPMNATGLCYYNTNTGAGNSQTIINSYVTMNPETRQNFTLELGIHCDVTLIKHIILRGQVALQFSELSEYGTYQITDMANGNTLYSGGYAIPTFLVSLFNATLGVGYRF